MIEILTIFGAEEAEGASGIAALGIDGKAFLTQLITFLVVFYILKKFVFGRVVDMLEKRRETIEKGVSLTSEMQVEKEKLEKEVEKTLKKAREDANDVLAKTHEQSSAMIKEAEEKAQSKVDAMIKEAKVKIADETARAKRSLEKELVELVINATEAVASEKLDAQKDSALIAKALKG